ncbi:hypothetical protein PR048_023829 [Dryococelus australis]|uniref:DUF4817 domain-containing protein n=1 Tax=Dryococelus australis TaxID=614101 RepID=A0ABQ9GV72_9NEOP|nr:hypothetical protein PR048_023829 [Dryococelus australis]
MPTGEEPLCSCCIAEPIQFTAKGNVGLAQLIEPKDTSKHAQSTDLGKRQSSLRYPKRKHRRKEDSKISRPVQVEYCIYTQGQPSISVCAKAFESITCNSRDRVVRLARTFRKEGVFRGEKSGGMDMARCKYHMNITESIIKHIGMSLWASKVGETLFIIRTVCEKRWLLWTSQQEYRCLYSKFHDIFMMTFNLGFGNPRSEVCSFCEEQNKKLQLATYEKERKTLMVDKRLHTLRENTFYSQLKIDPAESITVVFDCQQNQPLTKLSVSDTFYSRQEWFYNLAFMVYHGSIDAPKEEYISFHTWLETQRGGSSTEVTSALIHYFQHLKDKFLSDIHTVCLLSNSAAPQNKNAMVLAAQCGYTDSTTRWKKIEHYFPVRGNSYMPPDSVFGPVEKDLHKREVIVASTEYYDIFQQHGRVLICRITRQ